MAIRSLLPFFASISLFSLAAGCSNDAPTKPQTSSSPVGPTDSTAPMIVVSSPARSAMLKEGTLADGLVSVSGEACDSTGIASLNVLGSAVSVSGKPICASFDVQKSSRWGLSTITADATSAGGAAGSIVQSYLRSPEYFDPATSAAKGAQVPAAIVCQLNQDFLDDGNRGDVDDLDTILEKALDGADWNAYIPTVLAAWPDANGDHVVDTVTHNCVFFDQTNTATGYLVRKGGAFTLGTVTLNYVHAVANQLWVSITVTNLRLPLSVTGYLDPVCTPNVSANVTGSVLADGITVVIRQGLRAVNGELVSEDPQVDVYPSNLRLDIDWGPLSFISGLLDTITNTTISAFSKELGNRMASALQDVLPRFLNLAGELADQTLQTANPIDLGIRSGFDSFTIFDGGINFSLATQVYPKNPVLGRTALPYGAVRKNGTSPVFATTPYSIGSGVKDDAVNQFLWAAWAGGAFDFSAVVGDPCLGSLPGSIASVRAGLPPVLMPGRNGHEMEIGLGDLFVEYEAPAMVASLSGSSGATATASLYVSAVAGIDLSIDNTAHKLKASLDPNPEIHVQVVNADAGIDPASLRTGIEAAVQCLYNERTASVIEAFPLLELDLGSLGIPGISPGTKLGIAGAAIERRGDYMVLTGSAETR